MDTTAGSRGDTRVIFDAEVVAQRQIDQEARMLAEAEASVAAGLLVDVDAWIASIGTDHELPAPRPCR